MKAFILMAMLFCHIIDDYKLQSPVLTSLKQKSWWQEHEPNPMYKHDYIIALAMHAISWSFMIQLPVAIYYRFDIPCVFIFAFLINAITHGLVDDMKANRRKINLIADQLIHVVQIIITACVLLH